MTASYVRTKTSAARLQAWGRAAIGAAGKRAGYAGPVPDDAVRLHHRVTQGDRGALDELLQSYLPQLHAFVRVRLGAKLHARESSLDVVNSVCRELLSARDAFDFRGEDRFRAWLFTTALNKVRERHRRLHSGMRDVEREEPASNLDSFAAFAPLLTPSQDAIGHETEHLLREALGALEEDHREVITLARLVQLPHRVIAEVMDRSEEATRKLLARAMRQLIRELRQRGIDIDRWKTS